ncbi:MAG: putative quinol monooxygenase [Acidimicrobiia bacterium]
MAKLAAAPGRRDELVAVLQLALDNVENEAGTTYYLLHADDNDADLLWMYELYEAKEDLQAHMGAPWFAELGPKLAPLLGGRPELNFMTPLGGKGL